LKNKAATTVKTTIKNIPTEQLRVKLIHVEQIHVKYVHTHYIQTKHIHVKYIRGEHIRLKNIHVRHIHAHHILAEHILAEHIRAKASTIRLFWCGSNILQFIVKVVKYRNAVRMKFIELRSKPKAKMKIRYKNKILIRNIPIYQQLY
jgi:hypothetical protein